MYNVYGIIDRSGHQLDAEHKQSIDTLKKKFPSRSALFDFIHQKDVWISGTHIRSAQAGTTELFMTGEILNEDEVIAKDRQTDKIEIALLHLYLEHGETVFSTLNGSFIILIYSTDSGICRIINDQMGGLQVFYHADNNFILFGTELKYLFCHPRCPRHIDWSASMKRHIPFRVVNAERHYDAWFKKIELLEEGSVLEINATGTPKKRLYWDPWNTKTNNGIGVSSMTKERQLSTFSESYMELLDDAVRLRCQSAASAFSMFSGGVDSTIIASLARKYGDVGTFSFATQATVRDGATAMCLQLAQDLDLTNTQIIIPFDDIVHDGALWTKLIWSMESPFMHKDAIGKTALHAAISMVQPEVRHIMSGTGSDQLNGGLVRWFVQHPDDEHDEVVNWNRVMNELRTEMLKPVIGHQYDTFWGSRDLLHYDYLSSISREPLDDYPWSAFVRGCLHANNFVLIWDELRAGAWHLRGLRFPFMDYRFVPLLLDIPREFHDQLFFDKQILRRGAKKVLPEYLTEKPKGPVIRPGEDRRMNMYKEILFGQNRKVMDMLMDAASSRNMPIDRKKFEAKAIQLVEKPDQAEWAYVMHFASLMMLDMLPDQDENSMDMHPLIMPHVDVITAATPTHLNGIRKSLNVLSEDEMLDLPVSFAPSCSMVMDAFTGTYFLVKDGEMSYELDEDYPYWKSFLLAIDRIRSVKMICSDEGLDFETFREFFRISIEEGILQTMTTSRQHA
ncbi:MAG TPA: asparagine synthase-related protein [Saprospiraceae bacterium]|nr:asparagine synthase-related protein [Saprospiraceae bacterium]